MARTFNIIDGSLQHRFLLSRAKVQFYGGGFANGKTAGAAIKALQIAQAYPGCNGLIARSTYPKLNDTIRKEFLKWCPQHWIKSFPRSANGSNTCTFTNGSTINFRYIEQQGKGRQAETTTSNLLSATYDFIVVDQIEDPEITYKDFLDLLGRLRGNAVYEGDDPTMPSTGPRWFIITSNPTRNWVYQKLIKPLHYYQSYLARTGTPPENISDDLICERDDDFRPEYNDDGTVKLLIEIYEGSTYENKRNLESDFIKTLEAAYTGQMRDRFLLGKWAAYEGLVYPMFDEGIHVYARERLVNYLSSMQQQRYKVVPLEAYDYGMAVQSCYLFSFVDRFGNVFVIDGYYRKEYSIPEQREHIRTIRRMYVPEVRPERMIIEADPQIFKRSPSGGGEVGIKLSDLFYNEGNGVRLRRADNSILGGISKVQQYLNVNTEGRNPITGAIGAPKIYFAAELQFLLDEIQNYYWQKDTTGDIVDKPRDKADHAMDALKYLLSRRPNLTKIQIPDSIQGRIPTHWYEMNTTNETNRKHRYG